MRNKMLLLMYKLQKEANGEMKDDTYLINHPNMMNYKHMTNHKIFINADQTYGKKKEKTSICKIDKPIKQMVNNTYRVIDALNSNNIPLVNKILTRLCEILIQFKKTDIVNYTVKSHINRLFMTLLCNSATIGILVNQLVIFSDIDMLRGYDLFSRIHFEHFIDESIFTLYVVCCGISHKLHSDTPMGNDRISQIFHIINYNYIEGKILTSLSYNIY